MTGRRRDRPHDYRVTPRSHYVEPGRTYLGREESARLRAELEAELEARVMAEQSRVQAELARRGLVEEDTMEYVESLKLMTDGELFAESVAVYRQYRTTVGRERNRWRRFNTLLSYTWLDRGKGPEHERAMQQVLTEFREKYEREIAIIKQLGGNDHERPDGSVHTGSD